MATIRKDFRYKVIKNFFNKEEVKLLQEYCLEILEDPSKIPDSTLYDECFAINIYNDSLMKTFLKRKLPLVEKESGLKLFKTYSFWRYYGFNSYLNMHSDRPSCEISVTACINKTDNWPLIINNKKIELNIGDGLLYLGVEDPHGRPGNFKGDGMAQVFFHYVDQKGPFTHHQNDDYINNNLNQKWSEEDKKYFSDLKKNKNLS